MHAHNSIGIALTFIVVFLVIAVIGTRILRRVRSAAEARRWGFWIVVAAFAVALLATVVAGRSQFGALGAIAILTLTAFYVQKRHMCQACHGMLPIDRPNSFRFCPFCGVPIETGAVKEKGPPADHLLE